MEFRPCIDIHNGKVKQIVGGTLLDQADFAQENFVSDQDAAFFARLYHQAGIRGGHVILLNPVGSEYYQETKEQALKALGEYPGGLQIGGGITDENAAEYIRAGASHVIVTSFAFRDGVISYENLDRLVQAVGAKHIVLDVSCKKIGQEYYVMTDRWQKKTEVAVNAETLDRLAEYCDEFLVHAVDVEGKAQGIETELVKVLGDWGKKTVTYAGGVHSFEDLRLLKEYGRNKVHVTIGSALDLFGGSMKFEEVVAFLEN